MTEGNLLWCIYSERSMQLPAAQHAAASRPGSPLSCRLPQGSPGFTTRAVHSCMLLHDSPSC